MKEYRKIDTCFLRDDHKKIIEGSWTKPEFEFLKDNKWLWLRKIDGTNMRIIWDGQTVHILGKTDDAQFVPEFMSKMKSIFTPDRLKSVFGTTFVILYGEGYGLLINDKGKYYYTDANFILFDCLINNFWLQRHSLEDITKKLGIGLVDIIRIGTLQEAVEFTRNIKNDKENYLEGIVLKPLVDLIDRKGERIITKIKRRDFI